MSAVFGAVPVCGNGSLLTQYASPSRRFEHAASIFGFQSWNWANVIP